MCWTMMFEEKIFFVHFVRFIYIDLRDLLKHLSLFRRVSHNFSLIHICCPSYIQYIFVALSTINYSCANSNNYLPRYSSCLRIPPTRPIFPPASRFRRIFIVSLTKCLSSYRILNAGGKRVITSIIKYETNNIRDRVHSKIALYTTNYIQIFAYKIVYTCITFPRISAYACPTKVEKKS